jgi:hypothetical protein
MGRLAIGSRFHYDETGRTLYDSADGKTANAVAQFQPGVLFHANDMMIV